MPGVDKYKYPNLSFSGADMVATCYIPISDGGDGTISQVIGSLQTVTYSIHMDRKPVRSIGNINAKGYVMGPRTIAGTLIFAVFDKHFAYDLMKTIKTRTQYTNKFLADELPPFNITISFANEYGVQGRLALYGVQIVNEGQVMSINDIYTENTYQFVATDIDYLSDPDDNVKSTIMSTSTEIGSAYNSNAYNGISTAATSDGQKLASGAAIQDNSPFYPIYSNYDEVTLSVINVTNSKSALKKGVVELKLTPPQPSGYITIIAYDKTETIIDVSKLDGKATVGVPLYVSQYTAQYVGVDIRLRSNIIIFSIAVDIEDSNKYLTSPVIDFVSKNQVNLYSNVKSHNVIKYAEYDKEQESPIDYRYSPIAERIASVVNLIPNKQYTMSTYNQIDDTSSQEIIVSTFNDDVSQYDAMKQHINYNKGLLQDGTLDDYEAELDKAKEATQGSSMINSICSIKTSYKEESDLLKESDFPSNIEYDDAIAKYKKKISICSHIIKEIESTINNRVELIALNALSDSDKLFFVNQPKPKTLCGVDRIFVVDKSVILVDIYGRFRDKVTKQSISSFLTEDGIKMFKFFGDPGVRYTMRAIDSLRSASPIYEFYSMSDSERTLIRNDVLKNKELQMIETTSAEQRFEKDINELNLSHNNRERVIIETSKISQQLIFPKPTILIGESNVTIDVSTEFVIGSIEKEFYAVLSEVGMSYDNTMKQKIKITMPITEAVFNSYDHNMKRGKLYCVWIEDVERVQVSDSTTFVYKQTLTEEESLEEDEIRSFFIDRKIRQIKNLMLLKIGQNDSLDSIFSSVGYDSSVSVQNLYESIALQIALDKSNFLDPDKLIKPLYESKMELECYVNEQFFNYNIRTSNKSMKVIFPENYKKYMLTVLSIMLDGTIVFSNTETSTMAKEFTPVGLEAFVVLYATDDSAHNKSGFVFIDLLSRTISKHKLNTEVI